MEININTSLDEILKSNDISDDLNSLEILINQVIESRMTSLSTHIRGGGLSSNIKINGESIFYDKAAQMFSDYLILSSSINGFIARVKSASVEKEISELRILRNLLLRNNDSWQYQKEKYQKEYNEKMPTSNSIAGGGVSTVNLYTEYYGDNGKITLINKHIDANNQKIDQINIRLSNLGYSVATTGITPTGNDTSSSGGSYSGGTTHFSSSGGEHGGGGRTFPSEPSEDYIYGEHGGGNTSSSGGSYSGGTTNFSSSDGENTSSSGESYSGGTTNFSSSDGGNTSSSNSSASSTKNSGSSTSSSSNHASSTYAIPSMPVSTVSDDLPGKYIGPASDDDNYIELGTDEYYEWLKKVNIYDRYNIDPDNYDPNKF